jgi:hypothetical protein
MTTPYFLLIVVLRSALEKLNQYKNIVSKFLSKKKYRIFN